ncbi:MAG TPA: sigma-70 family RNA polymerase sigma factor [Urbifossiella sp.]|nr:sigma-70 family RNA polymerase sigma factor [Urbifossiella sp.]
MDASPQFEGWIARVRAGDEDAATELVRRYERAVRVAVRVRLTDVRLRRQFDSMDVCQSVMASFFVRAAAGQFDLQNPQQLVGLLVKMAQNKLLMQVRRHGQLKRDVGRVEPVGDGGPPVAAGGPGPPRVAAGRELLATLLDRLGPEERELAQRRALGQGWNEIAAELGQTPQAARMRLSRAIDRLGPALGLDDGLDFDT